MYIHTAVSGINKILYGGSPLKISNKVKTKNRHELHTVWIPKQVSVLIIMR